MKRSVFLTIPLIFSSAVCFAGGKPATASDIAGIKEAMEDRLKDSDSAKIKDVRLNGDEKSGWQFCGSVNAKNSYGAYSGFTPFMGMKLKGTDGNISYVVLGVDDSVEQVCRKYGL